MSHLPPAAILSALFVFALASTITPGPNNIMLTASGVNFGMRRTVPQMLGIFTGFAVILLATGFGLGLILQKLPVLRLALQVAGIGYTLFLAWKVASNGSLGGGDMPHPMPFAGAVAFQALNVKLWVMSISAMALYVRPGHMAADTLLVTLVFSLVNIPCMLIWTGFGAGLRDLLQVPGRIRFFNVLMGFLLAASVIPLLRM